MRATSVATLKHALTVCTFGLMGLCLILTSIATEATNPRLKWSRLVSPHFEVVFNEGNRETAEIFARAAERARVLVQPYFSEVPKKTLIVISDTSDLPNGFATFIPYAFIQVFPVLPYEYAGLGHYNDWAEQLILHEYVHILSMQPSNSFYRPLRWIFGQIVRPNAVLPRWHLEGVAVQLESHFSAFGRLNDPSHQASLRALALEKKLFRETLDRLNEFELPDHPFVSRPYLLGGVLWNEIVKNIGPQKIDEIYQSHSRRLPFLINAPIKTVSQKTYSDWLSEAYKNLSRRADQQVVQLLRKRRGEAAAEFKATGFFHRSPRLHPKGEHLLYLASRRFDNPEIRLRSRNDGHFLNGDDQVLFRPRNTLSLAWHPSGDKILFDQVENHQVFQRFRDLFELEWPSKKLKRLTRGLRAHSATYSPDGQRIVFVKNTSLRSELCEMPSGDAKNITVLVNPLAQERISEPHYLTNQQILYLKRSLAGEQGLYLYDQRSQKSRRLLSAYKDVHHLRVSTKGIQFTSAKGSGIFNLYYSPAPFKEARQLTQSLTEIASHELDPKTQSLIVSELTAEGHRLKWIKQPKKQIILKMPALLEVARSSNRGPTTSRSEAKSNLKKNSKTATETTTTPVGPSQAKSTPAQDAQAKTDELRIEEKTFWPIKYLLPQYWIPFVYPVPGGMFFQGSTASQDPVGINSYLADLAFDTVTEKLSYGLAYSNRSTPAELNLSWAEFQDYLGGNDLTLTNQRGIGGFGFLLSEKFRHQLFGEYARVALPDRNILRQGAGTRLTYSARGDFNSDQIYLNDTQLSFGYTRFLPAGPQWTSYDRYQATLAYSLNSIQSKRQSLVLQIKGTHSPGMRLAEDVIPLGEKTLGANYLATLINTQNLLRGYPSGAFTGRSLVNANLEYRFIAADLLLGRGSLPWFIRNLESRVFLDGVALDGAYFNSERARFELTEFNRPYLGTGLEFQLNTTAAYHLPLTVILGLYYGLDRRASGGFAPFIGLGYTPFSNLQ